MLRLANGAADSYVPCGDASSMFHEESDGTVIAL